MRSWRFVRGYRYFRDDLRDWRRSGRLTRARLPRWEQATSDHVQIGQGKGCKKSGSVLRQPAIAHLGKAPQVLDHMKGVLTASAGRRAQPIQLSLVGTEYCASTGAAVHPVPYPVLSGSQTVQLAPVGLVSIQRPFLTMQQL